MHVIQTYLGVYVCVYMKVRVGGGGEARKQGEGGETGYTALAGA